MLTNMNVSRLLAAAGVAMTMTMAGGVAVAGPIVGSAAIDISTTTGGPLAAGNVVVANGATYQSPGGDFVGQAGVAISNFSVTLTNFTAVSFTSAIGDFAGVVESIVVNPSFAIVSAQGVFNTQGVLASLDDNDMQLFLTFTAGQQGLTGSGSIFSDPVTPAPIPEPTSLALFGLALAGLIAARRKA